MGVRESLQGMAKLVVTPIGTRAVADAIGGTKGFSISDVSHKDCPRTFNSF